MSKEEDDELRTVTGGTEVDGRGVPVSCHRYFENNACYYTPCRYFGRKSGRTLAGNVYCRLGYYDIELHNDEGAQTFG